MNGIHGKLLLRQDFLPEHGGCDNQLGQPAGYRSEIGTMDRAAIWIVPLIMRRVDDNAAYLTGMAELNDDPIIARLAASARKPRTIKIT